MLTAVQSKDVGALGCCCLGNGTAKKASGPGDKDVFHGAGILRRRCWPVKEGMARLG